jgi:hypothetical protein
MLGNVSSFFRISEAKIVYFEKNADKLGPKKKKMTNFAVCQSMTPIQN